MGNALVMMAVPEESLRFSNLYVLDEETHKPVRLVQSRGHLTGKQRDALLEKHPDAFWMLAVPRSAVWEPPPEPYGLGEKPALRAEHTKKVRASLTRFLNSQLASLDRMVRTGWWILQRARVRMTTFEGVPGEAD